MRTSIKKMTTSVINVSPNGLEQIKKLLTYLLTLNNMSGNQSTEATATVHRKFDTTIRNHFQIYTGKFE